VKLERAASNKSNFKKQIYFEYRILPQQNAIYSVQRTLPHKEWRASNGLGLLNKESASKFALTGNTEKQTVYII
jgi:hypothetical protein